MEHPVANALLQRVIWSVTNPGMTFCNLNVYPADTTRSQPRLSDQ